MCLQENIDQPWQVPPTELPQNIESPLPFFSPTKTEEKFLPVTSPVWNRGPHWETMNGILEKNVMVKGVGFGETNQMH